VTDETKELMEKARALLAAATPGPWQVVEFWGENFNEYGIEHKVPWDHPDKPMHFAKVHPTNVQPLGDVLARANAALIAAAPGMLAALCDALAAADERSDEAERRADLAKMDERDRALAAAKSSAAAANQAADLLAKIERNDYSWPHGVAWACKEAHRLLTGRPPDGVYVRASADKPRDLDAEVVAGVQASRTTLEPKP
jgi:hypothetical protein